MALHASKCAQSKFIPRASNQSSNLALTQCPTTAISACQKEGPLLWLCLLVVVGSIRRICYSTGITKLMGLCQCKKVWSGSGEKVCALEKSPAIQTHYRSIFRPLVQWLCWSSMILDDSLDFQRTGAPEPGGPWQVTVPIIGDGVIPVL